MKRSLYFGVLLLLLCGFSNRATASHFAAVDLYMDYIGSGPNNLKYQVTLIVYKACEPGSIDLGTTEIVCWSSSCGGNGSRSFPTVQGPDTLDQLCAQFAPINACRQSGSPWPAFVRRVYSDTVTLPVACADWRFYWNNSARNSGIVNLQNPSGLSIYVEAGINNLAKWNNSSPRFIVNPIPYLCQNQPAFFLNGPLDPNNDSMVTVNQTPADASGAGCGATGVPTNYTGGYSLANPIASSTTYTVNPSTATATFTPANQGKFVLAFRCNEYDRITGTQLGYITRDVQVSVLSCNAAPPDVDTTPINLGGSATWITSSGGNYLIACPGSPFSFDISGNSNTISNALFMSSNNQVVIPGSTFSIAGQGTASPVGTFTWTPTGADVGDYTLIITVKDSTCNNNQPIVLPNYFVVLIKILPGVDAGPDGKICKLDGEPWQFNVTGPPNVPYWWTSLNGGAPLGLSNDTIRNPTAYPPYNFTYIVGTNAINSNCKNQDTVSIYIDTSNSIQATPKDAILCRSGYLQLNSLGIGNPPLRPVDCGTANPLPATSVDSVVINSQNLGGGNVSPSNQFGPFLAYRTAKTQYLFNKSDLLAYSMYQGTIRGISLDVITNTPAQYKNVTISIKCVKNREELTGNTGGFETGTVQVYSSSTPITLNLGWNKFDFTTPYNWDGESSLLVEFCYSNTAATTNPPTLNAVTTGLTQTGITWATLGTTSVCQTGTGPFTNYFAVRPVMRFHFTKAPYDDFKYTWMPGTFLSDSTTGSPLAYINNDTKFYVTTIGGNGCKVQDSVNVIVPVHNYDVFPRDTSFCSGESFKMMAIGDFAKVDWYEDVTLSDEFPVLTTATTLTCNNCTEPIGTPDVSTNYYAVMTDQYGCSDTMVVKAVVKQMPNVHIVNNDTTIKYGQSVQLLVSGAYLYSWQPLSTLTNPNIVNPIASPTEPTTYYVYGVAENGCRSMDSVKVFIDYRDNLFVPSAFSPNGDGKNDVFKVTNITFQRLLEFRVLNRWGQEIFSTNDPKKGWDGSWKGVAQDMGSYQYLIRVAYPDGYVETYKGNVTLVR